MTELLAKDAPTSLPQQLRDLIFQRIDSGHYQPGKSIDSIRKLAQQFNVSTLVVNQALQMLEEQHVIVRVPAKGVFVAENYQAGWSTATVALAFPENAISPEIMPAENWAIASEIHRGLLAGAIEHHAQVRFEHFPEPKSELQLNQQLRRLEAFDAAVFVGHQLRELHRRAAGRLPVIQVAPQQDTVNQHTVVIDYDRLDALEQLTRHVIQQGYTRCGVMTFRTSSERQNASQTNRAQRYSNVMLAHGITVLPDWRWEIDVAQSIQPQVRRHLETLGSGFVFCNHTEHLVDVYQAAQALGLNIGRDIGVACVSTGFTLQGASPSCTFVKTPLLEMGRTAAETAIAILAHDRHPQDQTALLKATLIEGRSTCLRDNP